MSLKKSKNGPKQINAVSMHVIAVVEWILGLCKSDWVDFTKSPDLFQVVMFIF